MNNLKIGKEQWLTEEELKILNTAMKLGYFESPRKITIDALSEELKINSQHVYSKLHVINRKVLRRFIEKITTPMLSHNIDEIWSNEDDKL